MNNLTQKELMTRKEYLMEQKEEKGRKLFGIFPAYYPKEILWAMNALPVEIWDRLYTESGLYCVRLSEPR
jgi:benzoyl-CoA reductase/2-hydroxyglutaryl-CoA dehydratase subunit BcrC/BadD/HgdB